MPDADYLAIIPKSSREDVRVSLDTYQGRSVIDVRLWDDFKAGAAGLIRTGTKKGVTLDVASLPALIDGLEAARAEAVARGLLEGSAS